MTHATQSGLSGDIELHVFDPLDQSSINMCLYQSVTSGCQVQNLENFRPVLKHFSLASAFLLWFDAE